jgi:hypothetical protein
MPRYRSHGQLDDPFIEDGDQVFTGLDAYTEPSLLQQGIVSNAENIRFDQGVAKVRKGSSKKKTLTNGRSLVAFTDPDGVSDLYVISDFQISPVFTNGTPRTLLQESGKNVNAIQLFNKLIIFDEGNRPQIWDGTSQTLSELSATPTITDGTFIACPDAPFGHYIANRLVVPNYSDSPTTVVCSDIFNENLFQLATGEFFLNRGTKDRTLAIETFQENQIICFNAESVHIVNNLHSLDSASFEITRQLGICGRKAVCQSGSYIYFMSNEGDVQVLVPSSDPAKGLGIAISKTTLDREPLSKPITPILDNLNLSALDKTILHYHRNRVYCAVCLNDETTPKHIAVYNSLLSVWESIDSVPYGILDIESFDGKLYLMSENAVFEYESSQDDDGSQIVGKITTRDYVLGSRDIKRFVRGTMGYASADGATTKITVQTKNPDRQVASLEATADAVGFSRMQRFSARQRGYSASVSVESTSGLQQTEIRRVSIEGFVANGRTEGGFDGN